MQRRSQHLDSEVGQNDSSMITYLLSKTSPDFRKLSVQSEWERPNFCCNISTENYTVLRVFIPSLTSNFVKLYYTKFTPIKILGQICFIHGFGESSDDYLTFAEFFSKIGYIVHLIDLRGFGNSGGPRIKESVKEILSDIQNLLRCCCNRNLETFVVAHGIGALLLNALLQQNQRLPLSGVIFLSPIFRFSTKNSLFHEIILALNVQLLNHLKVNSLINPTALMKNPGQIKKKIENNKKNSSLILKMAIQYSLVGDKISSQAYKFCYPLLIIRGGKDFIQEQGPVRQFFEKCQSIDKQFKIFPEGYHGLHHDYEGENVKKYILSWISERKLVKWKNVKPFILKGMMKNNLRKRKFIFLAISVLFGILALVKRNIKSCLRVF